MTETRPLNAYFLAVVLLACSPAGVVAQQEEIHANPERMEERIQALSRFGANPEGGVSRIAFSEADLAGRRYVMDLMRDAGLEVRVDTAGNIIGHRDGTGRCFFGTVFCTLCTGNMQSIPLYD